jgi:hypothetical protein
MQALRNYPDRELVWVQPRWLTGHNELRVAETYDQVQESEQEPGDR